MATKKQLGRWSAFGNHLSGSFFAAIERTTGLVNRHRFALGYAIILLGYWLLMPAIVANWMWGDVELYRGVAQDLLDGRLPYRDRALEYPPYSIAVFVLPSLLLGRDNYLEGFKMLALLADLLIKLLLLLAGLRSSKTSRALLPVLIYSLAVPFIHSFYLQRYDVWPALICLLAVWLFSSGHHALCGAAIAVGIGMKIYPAVFVPPLFILAARQHNGKRFVAGLAGGLLPILLLSFFLPWWRFAQLQGARGLQVESLYASVLWLGKLFGLLRVQWVVCRAWLEVQGPLASTVLPWARGLFAVAALLSAAFSTWAATKCKKPSAAQLARLLLIPLLAFVAFNVVFSPQFMIWLLLLAALASLEGNPWTVFAIPIATMLTPIFFPSPEYMIGLNLFETFILLFRNLAIVAACILLIRQSLPISTDE